MDIEEIRQKLEYMNLAKVSAELGLNHATLCRFANGTTKNPGYVMINKLADWLGDK